MNDLTELLAAVIRGDDGAAAALESHDTAAVRRAADRHGVLPLVAHRLAHGSGAAPHLRAHLIREARRRAAADVMRVHELAQCLESLTCAGIPVLLMKGAQLAYTHYERPDLRPRVDTDVLIPAEARGRVGDVLARCGHIPAGRVPGDLVMYQATYTKQRQGVVVHELDVHWRAANPQVFGAVLPYEELARSAVAVSGLTATARGLAPPYALLLACVHRVAHHFDSEYLIWIFDIHLIASRLTPSEWAVVNRIACESGVAAVCAQGLRQAVHFFHTSVPADVFLALGHGAKRSEEAATAAYMARRRRHVENVIADLRAIRGWTGRWRLVRQHLFPPPQYMRDVYAPLSAMPLPLLYVQRAVRGARKWLARVS